MEMRTTIKMRTGGSRDLDTKILKMSENVGVWDFDLDMKSELGLEGPRAIDQLNDIGINSRTYKI